jgi:hypothetical protein
MEIPKRQLLASFAGRMMVLEVAGRICGQIFVLLSLLLVESKPGRLVPPILHRFGIQTSRLQTPISNL